MIKKIFTIAFLLCIGGIATLMLLWHQGNVTPALNLPAPSPVPAPNAFDTLDRAYGQFHDLDKVDNTLSSGVTLSPDFSNGLKGITLTDSARIASENSPAVASLEHGLTESYCAPPWLTNRQTFGYLPHDRGMARAISFSARVAGRKGDWTTTIRESLDCIDLGNKIDESGGLLPKLVGLACGALGRPTAWGAVDHLDSQTALESGRRLETLTDNRASFSSTLHQEKMNIDTVVVNEFRQPYPLYDLTGEPRLKYKIIQGMYFTFNPKSRTLTLFNSYMDAASHTAKLPYQTAQKTGDPPLPRDMLCLILCPTPSKILFKDTADAAFDRLLTTSLALRAYSLDHGGAYPASLGGLCPKYLTHVPIDPFGNGMAPLIYRGVKSTYLLYSIGPDGKNDGGRPFLHRTTSGQTTRRWCTMDDTGDIVAGVNKG